MRIAQLTKYGSLAASTRQRFDQYENHLKASGYEIESWPLLDNRYLTNLYTGKRVSKRYLVKRYLERATKLMRASDIDLIWVNYELFPYLPGLFEHLVAIAGKPVVFDFDDAIFHNYDHMANSVTRLFLQGKLAPLLRRSRMAFCGNEYLLGYAQQYCADSRIVPTVLDTDMYFPAGEKSSADRLTVGWIGTPSTWNSYLKPMLPVALSEVAQVGGRVLAVGGDPVENPPAELHVEAWREESEVDHIQSMDIGIMPLDDSPWAKGKCGYKLIQYMACGIPVVASPVGVNTRIVEHGVNGFLAETEQEWRDALATLLNDPDLRQRMGAKGRAKIEQEYSLATWGPKVAAMLTEAAG